MRGRHFGYNVPVGYDVPAHDSGTHYLKNRSRPGEIWYALSRQQGTKKKADTLSNCVRLKACKDRSSPRAVCNGMVILGGQAASQSGCFSVVLIPIMGTN